MATKVKRGRRIVTQRSSVVPTHHAKHASEFLDMINPRSRHLGGPFYIFRGLASVRYALVPTALRRTNDVWSIYYEHARTMGQQIEGELTVLNNFYATADLHGLLPPDTRSVLRQQLDPFRRHGLVDQIKRGQASWLPDVLLYLAAVAQHHGVPTRLLDWTQHPFIAAYFAARGAVLSGRGGASSIVVWALWVDRDDDDAPDSLGEQHAGSGGRWPRALRLIGVSAAGNAKLKAQRGLFTLFRPEKIDLDGPIDRRPLNELLSGRPNEFWPWLTRFTLPSKEAGHLMVLLEQEGISAATLFPGLGGVVEEMRESYLSLSHPHAAEALRR